MDLLGNILNRASNQSPLVKGVRAALLIDKADDFLKQKWGAQAEKHARALYVKNRILTIACLSSIMAQEIRMQEKQLLAWLNAGGGGVAVEKVRYLS